MCERSLTRPCLRVGGVGEDVGVVHESAGVGETALERDFWISHEEVETAREPARE